MTIFWAWFIKPDLQTKFFRLRVKHQTSHTKEYQTALVEEYWATLSTQSVKQSISIASVATSTLGKSVSIAIIVTELRRMVTCIKTEDGDGVWDRTAARKDCGVDLGGGPNGAGIDLRGGC